MSNSDNIPDLIAQQFQFPFEIGEVRAFGDGLINETFLVSALEGANLSAGAILQKLNTKVFPNSDRVMNNIVNVASHINKLVSGKGGEQFHIIIPEIYFTRDNAAYYQNDEDEVWRAMEFIAGTQTHNTIDNLEQAEQAGRVLGEFHLALDSMDVTQLEDTLPGFHVAPIYLAEFDKIAQQQTNATEVENKWQSDDIAAKVRQCITFIESNRNFMHVLENARSSIRTRVTHGDPKFNNFLFSKESGNCVALIDLDTVKPGLIHYDIGDCLRSCCNTAGEMPKQLDQVRFDLGVCKAILTGYLTNARLFLEHSDYNLMFDAIRLLPLELGLRFFSDFLNGNQYFKVHGDLDNLSRALVQFRLVDEIDNQEKNIRLIIDELSKNN